MKLITFEITVMAFFCYWLETEQVVVTEKERERERVLLDTNENTFF